MLPLLLAAHAQASELDAFVELGGSGGLGSVNVAVPVGTSPWLRARVGLSTMPLDRNTGWVVIVPALLEAESSGPLSVVAGAGLGLSCTTKLHPHARGVLELGGRWRPEGPLWVGAAYTPLVSFLADRQWEHWAGLQVGTSW